MIIDDIKNISNYEELKEVSEFLSKKENLNLESGKYPISDNCYVSVSSYETKDSNGIFEGHKKYIDVQCMMSGEEYFLVNKSTNITLNKEYNEEKDIVFYTVENCDKFIVKEGQFAVFYPTELHRPSIKVNNPQTVKKYVFKIKCKE